MNYNWTDLKHFGKSDSAGRWYPTEPFFVDYCRGYRSPSRTYPYSYAKACMTLKAYRAHQAYLNSTKEDKP